MPTNKRKFTPDQVRYIRKSGKRLVDLAAEFNVAVNTIALIRRRVTYRDVE